MTKRQTGKRKLEVHKKSLRKLTDKTLGNAQGGLTGECDAPTLNACHTDDCETKSLRFTGTFSGKCG